MRLADLPTSGGLVKTFFSRQYPPITMISPVLLIPALAFIGRMHASAVIPYDHHNTPFMADASPQAHASACNDIHHCRTTQSIVYSCLATIFICTWFTYHPDVPNRTYTRGRIRATRFVSRVLSFLLPELTVAKAATQCWKVLKWKPPVSGTS